MIPLAHIVEPARLLVTWQPSDEASPDRTRRVIGEVVSTGGEGVFRYLDGSDDFQRACASGFASMPSFDRNKAEHSQGVLQLLLRRLPPRKREDFEGFLQQHRLPSPFPGSDLALLGYTGARLPSDGFALVPDFDGYSGPIDFITEVAGLRHVFSGDASSLRSGQAVQFRPAKENAFDNDAVEIYLDGAKLGFVNRALRGSFVKWMQTRTVTGTIERLNGRPDRPLLYLRVGVR